MFKIIVVILAVVLALFLWQRSGASKKLAADNIAVGAIFLAENTLREEVATTASGLQYQRLETGSGTVHPGPKDTVKVHYHGTLLDGTVFDSSVDRGAPIEFGLHQVIKGWSEGLQLMVVGEKMQLFIPSELAYGNRSAGAISPGSTLIFEVELLGINP